jgi:hypothetical protein
MHHLRFEDTLLVVYEIPLSVEKMSIDGVTEEPGHVLNCRFMEEPVCLSRLLPLIWTVADEWLAFASAGGDAVP